MPRPSSGIRGSIGTAVLVLVVVAGIGCASRGPSIIESDQLAEAIAHLNRPMAGNLAALYDLRVAKTGGLRLAVITDGGNGRMTVSEPFGAAVSLTAWSAQDPSVFFDMELGCRREIDDLEEVLGASALPLGQAVRLLGGRLPVMPDDQIESGAGGVIEVRGAGWAAWIRLASDPWRVVEVGELRAPGGRGWHLELGSHTSSVPGSIRFENDDGRWAVLDLKRLEWPEEASLPDLPDFESCDGW